MNDDPWLNSITGWWGGGGGGGGADQGQLGRFGEYFESTFWSITLVLIIEKKGFV